jgi:hypothetical protein
MNLFDSEAKIGSIVGVLLAVAGIALALLGNGDAMIIGAGLVGMAAVILLAVDFYLVGRSEDIYRRHRPHG